MLEEYEENCHAFEAQAREYETALEGFESEVRNLEALLHSSVDEVINDLKTAHLELKQSLEVHTEIVPQQLDGLKEALQTAATLKSMMQEFHSHFVPSMLIESADDQHEREHEQEHEQEEQEVQ